MRPFWSMHCIWSNVWAGLRKLSTVTMAFLTFVAPEDSFSDNSQLNNSSATGWGREVNACWPSYSGPANWSSQLMQYSPKILLRCSHVLSRRCFVCNKSLVMQIEQHKRQNLYLISVKILSTENSCCHANKCWS